MDELGDHLEPNGGNLYRPHRLMVHSGEFWRCRHGNTGFVGGMEWEGCDECRAEDPEAAKKFEEGGA